MKPSTPSHPGAKAAPSRNGSSTAETVLVRGIGIELPTSLRTAAATKAAKLVRHHERIIRIRLDFEGASSPTQPAVASGRVELSGPDLVARVSGGTLGESLDLLIDKLDRMLRERGKRRVNRRNDPVGEGRTAELVELPST